MMFRYPSFGMPYFNRYSRYGYQYPSHNNLMNSYDKNFKTKHQEVKNTVDSITKNNCENKNQKTNDYCKDKLTSSESPLFNIFGINLYFDDILLICLILFLYDEGVDDEWLYIVLILLLLG